MLLKEWHKEKLPQLLKFNHSNTSILNKHKNNLFLFKNMFKKQYYKKVDFETLQLKNSVNIYNPSVTMNKSCSEKAVYKEFAE